MQTYQLVQRSRAFVKCSMLRHRSSIDKLGYPIEGGEWVKRALVGWIWSVAFFLLSSLADDGLLEVQERQSSLS